MSFICDECVLCMLLGDSYPVACAWAMCSLVHSIYDMQLTCPLSVQVFLSAHLPSQWCVHEKLVYQAPLLSCQVFPFINFVQCLSLLSAPLALTPAAESCCVCPCINIRVNSVACKCTCMVTVLSAMPRVSVNHGIFMFCILIVYNSPTQDHSSHQWCGREMVQCSA